MSRGSVGRYAMTQGILDTGTDGYQVITMRMMNSRVDTAEARAEDPRDLLRLVGVQGIVRDAEVPERLMRGDRRVLHLGGFRRGGCLRPERRGSRLRGRDGVRDRGTPSRGRGANVAKERRDVDKRFWRWCGFKVARVVGRRHRERGKTGFAIRVIRRRGPSPARHATRARAPPARAPPPLAAQREGRPVRCDARRGHRLLASPSGARARAAVTGRRLRDGSRGRACVRVRASGAHCCVRARTSDATVLMTSLRLR